MNQDEYEDLVFKMQRLHKELDQSFLEINKIVPYDRNGNNVYSPRYDFILQDASRQVDGMLKLIYGRLEPFLPASATKHMRVKFARKAKPGFLDYHRALNYDAMLSFQKVALKEDVTRVISPFVVPKESAPQWWQAYNDTKHDLPEGDTFGRLIYVLHALAAVAILHDIAQVIFNQTVLKTVQSWQKWHDYFEEFMREYRRTKNREYGSSIVTHAGERAGLWTTKLRPTGLYKAIICADYY